MEEVRVLSPVLLLLGNGLFGTIPHLLHIRVAARERHPRYTSGLVLFCGGVLFGLVLLELLPDAIRRLSRLDIDFPIAEALLCLGFIFLFLIQEGLRALYMWRQRRFTDGSPAEVTPFGVGGSAGNGSEYGSIAASTQGGDSRLLPTPVAFTYPVFYAETLVLLALAIHLVLDGVSIAIQTTPHQAWMAFSQVAMVSYLSSFVIATLLYTSDLHVTLSLTAGIIFSLLVTSGALVGLATRRAPGNLAHGVLDGLVSGGLLYVIFFGVLQRSRHLLVPGLAQFALTSAGTVTVGIVKLVVPVVP